MSVVEKLWRFLPNWYLRRWVADRKMRRHHHHIVAGRCVAANCPNT
jgi:hypothetical protein